VAICVLAFVLSLFFLEVTFVGDYTFPLLIGGACGLLAARLAFALARARYGVPLAEVDTPRVDKPGAGRVESWS
jgi:hypothetical protein